jgi:hypothetical protein
MILLKLPSVRMPRYGEETPGNRYTLHRERIIAFAATNYCVLFRWFYQGKCCPGTPKAVRRYSIDAGTYFLAISG